MERHMVMVPEVDLVDVYRLLIEKETARAGVPTRTSAALFGSENGDSDGDRADPRAQVWRTVMPEARLVLTYLAEHDHRDDSPIAFGALRQATGIRVAGAVKSIHHWTAKAGLPEYALLKARVEGGETVYWLDASDAEFVRTMS